jgi:hypothetical protein
MSLLKLIDEDRDHGRWGSRSLGSSGAPSAGKNVAFLRDFLLISLG